MAYSQEATDLDEFIFGTDCTTVESSRLLAIQPMSASALERKS